jgi:hypothetical protein
MIFSWLLAALALGAVIAVGGSSVARLAAIVGVRSRWAALVLMVCSVALPIGLAIRSPAPATTALIAAARPASRLTVAAPSQQQLPPSHEVDLLLLAGWGSLALGTGALFAASYRRLHADVAGLPRRELCGQMVALSDDLGPAAVGSEVVLPAWVFELPLDEQRLVLRHECEHVRARDHAVLFGGIVLVIMMPWNLGLWWQLRRLRVAVELDCDARVTPAPQDRPRYAELLLRSRDRAPARRMVLAFASTRSALAERLLALLDGGRPTVRRVTGWSLSTAACAVLITQVPVPELAPLISRPVVASTASGPSAGLPATAALVNPIGYALSQGKGTAKRNTARAAAAGHLTARVVNPKVNTAPGDSAVAASVPSVRYDSLVPYVRSAATASRGFGGGRGTSFQQPEAVRATRDSSSPQGPGR